MTLLFMDGFDHHQSDMALISKWDTCPSPQYFSCGTAYARPGSIGVNPQGLQIADESGSSNLQKYLTESSTLIAGFAFRSSDSNNPSYDANQPFMAFMAGGTIQIGLWLMGDLCINLRLGGGTYIGSTLPIIRYAWNYIEIKVLFSPTVGTAEVRLNGDPILAVTGINTSASGGTTGSRILFDAVNNDHNVYLDDVYVCNGLGTKNNDFLGPVRIATIRPNAAGFSTDFTPSAGANFECVDDVNTVGTATYNSHDVVGEKDSYNLDAIPEAGTTIHGIAVNSNMKKSDSGVRSAHPLVRVNSTDYSLGSSNVLAEGWEIRQDILEINPDDSADWEDADINALEVGVEVV